MLKQALCLLVITSSTVSAQKLVEPVTNNSVVALRKNNQTIFYSFFGLDSTKRWSGVHNKIIRYDVGLQTSSIIGHLPDSGRLASAASVLQNKAYIVGGYAVLENGKEKSSNKLFIFDPLTEHSIPGSSLPVRIDDHVQSVWRNKLLYVISGWSDSVNVSTVQVYNPKSNQWQLATPLPNEITAKVFGGCGQIVGDTIYFLGGATFAKYYPPSRRFYKGVINKKNPLQIKWINAGEYPGEFRYRSATFTMNNLVYFIGGSNETYNYNGISYSEKKPVEPNQTILVYNIRTGKFTTQLYESTMDLRGVVQDGKGNSYILGGILSGQKVSDQVKLLRK